MNDITFTMMDVPDLEMLLAIKRAGTLRGAAASLATVQSNLSARLRKLEDELGVKLFDRSRRELTPAGRKLAEGAEEVLERLDALSKSVASDASPASLKIGLAAICSRAIGPALVETFAQAREPVPVEIVEGLSSELMEAVAQGRLDFAVAVASTPSMPGLEFRVLYYDQIFLCLPRERYARAAAQSPERVLPGANMVLPTRDLGYRRQLDSYFSSRLVKPPVVVAEIPNVHLLEEVAFRTRLATALPGSAISAALAHSFWLEVFPQSTSRPVGIFTRVRGDLNRWTRHALDVTVKAVEQLKSREFA